MKFKDYLADKLNIIIIFLLSNLLIEFLLYAFSISIELNIFFLSINLISFLACFLIQYFQKAIFLKELQKQTELLDQKFLVHEILPSPNNYEEEFFYQVISEINRSMLEQINQYKLQFHDLKEYLELWIHEVKLPIVALRLSLEHPQKNSHNFKQFGKTRRILSLEDQKNLRSLEQLDRLDNYVNQILYFARSEHVEKDYQISECNLSSVVKHVALKNQEMILNANIQLETNELNRTVETDPKWLEFILDQILANCIKYRKKIHSKIRIYTEETNRTLDLHIYDNGIGIPLSDQSRIFQKAFTGQNGRILEQDQKKKKLLAETEHLKSTGMGLYIVGKLIKKLGHQISVSSTEYEYTDIVIHFAKNDYYKNVRNRNIENTTK